jgi:hypothetical protein
MKKYLAILTCIGTLYFTAAASPSSTVLPAASATSATHPATPLWKTVVNEDGIRIESKASGIDNLLSFKAHTQIPAKRERIQQEILNVKQYIHWIPRTAEIVVLKEADPKKEVFFFGTGKGFFPILEDRNLLVRLDVREQTFSHSLLVMERIQPSAVAKVPPISGVLIPFIRLEWSLYDTVHGSTEVTLFLTADPGGSIPDWIVNLAMQKYPLHTLQALRKRSQTH